MCYKTGLLAKLGAVASCVVGGVGGAGFADPNPVLVAPLVPEAVAGTLPKPLPPKPLAAVPVLELPPKPVAGVDAPKPLVEPKPPVAGAPNAEAPDENPVVGVVAPLPNPPVVGALGV